MRNNFTEEKKQNQPLCQAENRLCVLENLWRQEKETTKSSIKHAEYK